MNIDNETGRRWLEALESKDYLQGTGQLRDIDDGYCCLGVLCDVAREAVGLDWSRGRFSGGWVFGNRERDTESVPPTEVADLVEMTDYDQEELIELNDTTKATFPAIASAIREMHRESARSDA